MTLIIANFDEVAQDVISKLGARSVDTIPMSLEEACVAYLDERGERNFFFEKSMVVPQ